MAMIPDTRVLICSNDDYVFLFTREFLLQPFCYHFASKVIDKTYLYGMYTIKVDFSAIFIQQVINVYSGYASPTENIYEHLGKDGIDSKESLKYYDFDMDLSDTFYGHLIELFT